MGDGSPHTDTSTEMDPDDNNQSVIKTNTYILYKLEFNYDLCFLLFLSWMQFDIVPSNPFMASGSSDKQKEKFPEQKVFFFLYVILLLNFFF